MAKKKAAEEEETTPQVVSDLISLVTGVVIPVGVTATWTPAEREDAARWAGMEHLAASDNTGVKRVPQPPFVARAAELASNPALAQLAVERWVMHKEEAGRSWPEGFTATDVAQDAITGLLVLLGDERPVMTWQAKARAVLGAHPEGVTPTDLAALIGRYGPSREALNEWLTAGEDTGTLETILPDTWRLRGATA